ncbi:MAG TPA: hypothetical protein VFG84_06615 [Gemmatimonadaceae bacterium]|nr:hypothetical protein [Gemmatimonadaceae bacterium]
MQTLVQVFCSRGPSLREAIARDGRLEKFGLQVVKMHQPGRSPGWLKLSSTRRGGRGVVNIEWDADTRLLTCRMVTRGVALPATLLSDFLNYLLSRRGGRIRAVMVIPRT